MIPLGDYESPAAPTLDVLQRLRDRLLPMLDRSSGPAVRDDRLERAEREILDDYAAAPDYAFVVDGIDETVDGWLGEATTGSRLLLLVMPPCEHHGLIERVAERRGFELLAEPGRDAVLAGAEASLPEVEGTGANERVLVVPRLERWFLRHRHGLLLVRSLLARLTAGERRCIVAINSWGWEFIAKAARAELLLPAPMTLRPFDAHRLRDWLLQLNERRGSDGVTVRSSGGDGEHVLALDDDGELREPFLLELASRSTGIPWVAWEAWRRGLRTLPDEGEGDDGGEGEGEGEGARKVLWVTHDEPAVLPAGHEREALLVLQALLIHASLHAAELERVLPLVGESGILEALWRTGFVDRGAEGFHCRPVAYPVIRAALNAAGYPLPRV